MDRQVATIFRVRSVTIAILQRDAQQQQFQSSAIAIVKVAAF
jgi:hypothetical protein